MAIHYLSKLFAPQSIAVIGASVRPNAIGTKVFSNIIECGYQGKLYAVNPKYTEVKDRPCVKSILEINAVIDLVIIVTPAHTVTDILIECGKKQVPIAVIIAAGFAEIGTEGEKLQDDIASIAKQFHINVLGPNCLGFIRPSQQLNATFSNNTALPGNIALVSQSGAFCASILDWALPQKIGFSGLVSIGNAMDIDFADLLDFFAYDTATQSILLYIEGIKNARRFMSSLRLATRVKPVIVLKAGRFASGSAAAISHTGALIGADDVFDAALHRAGAVRVFTIAQLFAAAEILSRNYQIAGNRLAIVTNGGGLGVMAADRASELNVALPALSTTSLQTLNQLLPNYWSKRNPLDILGNADAERYAKVIDACIAEPDIDGVLAMLTPVVNADPTATAEKIIAVASASTKPVLACWLGGEQVARARELFSQHRVPDFSVPEAAIEAFHYLAAYHHGQELLAQVPPPITYYHQPDIHAAHYIIEQALSQQRNVLTTMEAKAVLSAFGIPVSQPITAIDADTAVAAAEKLGYPVVMKINSPDITHKQDVGGVQLNLANATAVKSAFVTMLANVQLLQPQAHILGVTVERMFKQANDRELMIGVMHDRVFGPVISFGAGGTIVEIMQDRALALPPLNSFIAKQLIQQTRIAKLLGPFRNMPAVNVDAIVQTLLSVSEMVCELPHIQEMDINPLIANDQQVIAVDARIVVTSPKPKAMTYYHMAIAPYPSDLITTDHLKDGTAITIRPIRPEDAELEKKFVQQLSPQTKYFRFMSDLHELTPAMLVRFTQIDYDREMALLAVTNVNQQEICLGITRYVTNPDGVSAEFAIVIADAWQSKGLGVKLLTRLFNIAKKRGLHSITGEVLENNVGMLNLMEYMNFAIEPNPEDPKLRTVIKYL